MNKQARPKNHYFEFKQFTVHQDKCAMKVCTDSCVFGAFIANFIQLQTTATQQILDIGSGTGLLSLLLAQKTNAVIDAIDIDADACTQSRENFDKSIWKNRLHIFHDDIVNFQTEKKYDLIISNPPFFEDDLRSEDLKKNNAKHDTSLTLSGLLKVIDDKLSSNGLFAVLLPFHRINYFEKEASISGYYIHKKLLIKQTTKHDFFRGVLILSKESTPTETKEISIRNNEVEFSNYFVELLKDYYLHL